MTRKENWRRLNRRIKNFILASGDLLSVLLTQAFLSARLIWSNTAFADEALYLKAGHLEIAHWISAAAIPAFPAYFSGAPVLYPPLGALADSIGGLSGARLLSLSFMLGTTSLLWASTSRLYGRRAGFFAAAIFALLGPTLRLGAYATYDAMSLFLLALSTWCALRAAQQRQTSAWLVSASLALAAANVTKYATALLDPVVISILFLRSTDIISHRAALRTCGTMISYTVGTLFLLFTLGGNEYITGIEQTTINRTAAGDSVSAVLHESWQLTALTVVLAIIAAFAGLRAERTWNHRSLLFVLAGASILVPLDQAHIHTLTSLNKHVDFGAWFAAIAAGYATNVIITALQQRMARLALTVLGVFLLFIPLQIGASQAAKMFSSWPNSAAVVTVFRQLLPKDSGPILDDNNQDIPQYYLPTQGNQWYRWSSIYSLRLPHGKAVSVLVGGALNPALFKNLIENNYFSVIILNFGSAASFDAQLLTALDVNPSYHLAAAVPYGVHVSQIWEYEPQSHFSSDALRPDSNRKSEPLGSLLTPAPELRPIFTTVELSVLGSLLLILVFTLAVRFGWRRGKASNEL